MKILHSASLGLVDGCNVIVLLGISANQRNTDDSGGRLDSMASGWWTTPTQVIAIKAQKLLNEYIYNFKNPSSSAADPVYWFT